MVVKPFSCSGKKRAKRSRPKGRYGQMRPLRYPPPHYRNCNAKSKGIMPLTYYVFALAFGEFVKTTAILVQVSPIFPAVRREGYIGEGAFVRSASHMPLSLVTFLCGYKKVTPFPFQNRALNCNLPPGADHNERACLAARPLTYFQQQRF